ncbi:MAG TPA: methyltransferase [Candidatus Nanoarchaeia archaeon]|nr:methyltransferase [Candidatus Nanoarchaeia archaeon]
MSWKSLLRGKLPSVIIDKLPSAFDVIGHILVFNEFPSGITKWEKKIGGVVLQLFPHVKTVVKKSGKVSGRLRVPKVKWLAGDKSLVTTHKENGVVLRLDIGKCYFSPRSSSERLRVAQLVKKHERVLVLFSGVGPFPCVISKLSKPKEVVAVEVNKVAHQFAVENVKLNKLSNVIIIQGDVKKVLPKLSGKFDRVVMPLPKSAEKYLPLVMKLLTSKAVVHLYTFAKEEEFSGLVQSYRKTFKKVSVVKAGVFAPGVFRICLDLQL